MKGIIKTVAVVIASILLLSFLSSCEFLSEIFNDEITALEINEAEKTLFFDEEISDCFTVIGTDEFSPEDFEFISENQEIATVEYVSTENDKVYYSIRGVSAGVTNIRFKTIESEISSDSIMVTVKPGITSIKILKTDDLTLEMEGTAYEGVFSVEYESGYHPTLEMLTLVVDDPAIVGFSTEKGTDSLVTVKFHITPLKQGKTNIYISTTDGKVQSNKVSVSVIEKPKEPEVSQNNITAEETKTKQNASSSNAASVNKGNPSGSSSGSSGSSSGSSGSSSSSGSDGYDGSTVYITPTGKKYHYSKSCAGKNAIPTTLNQASKSYGPCKKCVG